MDFIDTAAIQNNSDLLISSDSAVVRWQAQWEFQPGWPCAGSRNGDGA